MDLLNEELRAWSQTYNYRKPHQTLGKVPPKQYELIQHKSCYKPVAA